MYLPDEIMRIGREAARKGLRRVLYQRVVFFYGTFCADSPSEERPVLLELGTVGSQYCGTIPTAEFSPHN